MELLDFLIENALILVPVLWIIGKLLKNSPFIGDWLIPWVLLVFGIVFAMGYLGMSWENLFQGIVAAGVAVFTHQLLRQTTERS